MEGRNLRGKTFGGKNLETKFFWQNLGGKRMWWVTIKETKVLRQFSSRKEFWRQESRGKVARRKECKTPLVKL